MALGNLMAAQINKDHLARASEAAIAADEAATRAQSSTYPPSSAAAAAEIAKAAADRAAQPHAIWSNADLVFDAPLAEGYEHDSHPVFVALLERLVNGAPRHFRDMIIKMIVDVPDSC